MTKLVFIIVLCFAFSSSYAVHDDIHGGLDLIDYVKTYASSDSKIDFNIPTLINIEAIHSSICQIRLDFVQFNLHQPDKNGICHQEWMRTYGQRNFDMPILCGFNTGQHVYLNFADERTPIQLSIKFWDRKSTWKIKATQIECSNNVQIAAEGCLQYFTESSGTVKSLNYPGQHLANQDYNICLSGSGSCVTWREDSGVIDVGPHVPDPFTGCDVLPTDHLTIPGGTVTFGTTTIDSGVVCGERNQFPETTITGTGIVPAITVYFDENEDLENSRNDPTLGRMGFQLDYTLC